MIRTFTPTASTDPPDTGYYTPEGGFEGITHDFTYNNWGHDQPVNQFGAYKYCAGRVPTETLAALVGAQRLTAIKVRIGLSGQVRGPRTDLGTVNSWVRSHFCIGLRRHENQRDIWGYLRQKIVAIPGSNGGMASVGYPAMGDDNGYHAHLYELGSVPTVGGTLGGFFELSDSGVVGAQQHYADDPDPQFEDITHLFSSEELENPEALFNDETYFLWYARVRVEFGGAVTWPDDGGISSIKLEKFEIQIEYALGLTCVPERPVAEWEEPAPEITLTSNFTCEVEEVPEKVKFVRKIDGGEVEEIGEVPFVEEGDYQFVDTVEHNGSYEYAAYTELDDLTSEISEYSIPIVVTWLAPAPFIESGEMQIAWDVQAQIVVIQRPSGIYSLTAGKSSDTLYSRSGT